MSQSRTERESVDALVANFASNIAQLRSPATKEATLRVQYLDPLFTLLAWDLSNDTGLPIDEQEVIIEPSIDVAERDKLRARRPDYLFRIGGQNQLTCEAKKPAVDIDRDKDAIFQTKRDAHSMGLPFTILTRLRALPRLRQRPQAALPLAEARLDGGVQPRLDGLPGAVRGAARDARARRRRGVIARLAPRPHVSVKR